MAETLVLTGFSSHFNQLIDPRIDRKKLYPLQEILLVVLCGAVCGAESWRDFVLFGEEKLPFLRQHFPFEHGIPCKNTFARLLAALDPVAFRACFIAWVKSLQAEIEGVIAIDGKTLCNSMADVEGATAIHRVSAFAAETRLVLAQQKVTAKSNEITAIPLLLDLLDLSGKIVTLDAMGCQKSIAKKIREKGADYVLALKGNQGHLNDDVRLFLETEIAKAASVAITDRDDTVDKGHGRIERRVCVVSPRVDWLVQASEWTDLNTLAMIEETRELDGKPSVERRFFISSLPADAKQIAAAVRAHWAIENTLHWTLDVTFNEDQSRVRKDNAGENMAIVRHIAFNMLSNTQKHFKNTGLKALRKKAGWGNATLELIIRQNF
jgi:predicted transposase YbfD/YdcC